MAKTYLPQWFDKNCQRDQSNALLIIAQNHLSKDKTTKVENNLCCDGDESLART